MHNDSVLVDGKPLPKITIYKADFCVAVIEYFGFEKNKPEALFAFRKFASMGFSTWIQGINKWQPEPKDEYEEMIAKAEAHLEYTKKLAEHKRQIKALQEEQEAQNQQINQNTGDIDGLKLEMGRYSNGHGQWYSIVAWWNIQGREISLKEASRLGRKASSLCRKHGIAPETVKDPRFGKVNLYPESILSQVAA